VHQERGGDLDALHRLADRIEASRRQLADQTEAALRPARLTAALFSAAPPGVAVVLAVVDPAYLQRLSASPWSVIILAGLLTAVGASWLRQLARPPFALRPSTRRGLVREQTLCARLGDLLDRSALYAAAGLDVGDALTHAASHDTEGLARRLRQLLSKRAGHGVLRTRDAELFVGRCARALMRWLEEGASPGNALALTAAHLRLQEEGAVRGGASRLFPAMLLPLTVFIVPAAILLVRV
jgi:hypothetical protein